MSFIHEKGKNDKWNVKVKTLLKVLILAVLKCISLGLIIISLSLRISEIIMKAQCSIEKTELRTW
jgi:hypothetical protein